MNEVDGINKIKKEDVKKSRNIVLSTIEKYDNEIKANDFSNGAKKKIISIDGLRKGGTKKLFKNINKDIVKSITQKKVRKDLPQIVNKNIDSHVNDVRIKKISKGKRDIWLSDMKNVFGVKKQEIKESEYKIKKVAKQENEEIKKPVFTQPKEKESIKEIEKKKKEKIETQSKEVKNFFEYDLTPALARKIHKEKKNKVNSEKITKKTFFHRLEEKKKEKKIRKEKLILEKKEAKKKIKEKKEELKKNQEKLKFEKVKKLKKKKQQRKAKIKKIIFSFKFESKNFFYNLLKNIKASFKFSLLLVLMVFSTAFFCYLIFFTLLVKLDFDNHVLRKIADIFPVPVIISDNGIIEYYKYKDFKDDFYNSNKELINFDFKVFLIKNMIISNLAREYNFKLNEVSNEQFSEEIGKKIVFDNTINQVAINRIRKIFQLIGDGEDFMKIASRYGDSQGLITIDAGSENKFYNFKTNLPSLKEGETSRIEYATDGYYIFQSVHKSEKSSDLNYVYIKAKTFDEYIAEEIVSYHMWSFVD